MTFRHLKIYIAVYQEESITRAAKALFMTQPAVTRAIHEIETYYGVRLFERISRRLYVTEAGRSFYAYALHIVDSFDQLEKGMRNWDELGMLRVGASVTIGSLLLPQVVAAFRKRHAGVEFRATVANGQTLLNALLNNQLDFAVIEGDIISEPLRSEWIADDRLVPVLPPDSAYKNASVPLSALAKEPLLFREHGSAGRTCIDHAFALHGLSADPVLESISTRAIVQAVHLGLGISFLPEQLVAEELRSGFLATCHVTDESFTRRYHLVWHEQKFLTASAKEAMELFREAAAASAQP